MPLRSLSGDFDGPLEAPPSYDLVLSPQEFEQKAADVAEQTIAESSHVSEPGDTGKGKKLNYDDFEDWDDARFEAAAAAYKARLARQQATASGGSSSTTMATPSSTYRSQSPGRPGPSQQSVSPEAYISPQNATQPHPSSQGSLVSQRALPARPTEQYRDAQPSLPAFTPPSRVSDIKTSMPWISTGMSDDGHGRASMEAPPPFAPMASPTSEYSETFELPRQNFLESSVETSVAHSAPSAIFRNVPPPPPINLPQAPASAPLLPTSSSLPPPMPPVLHRHSDVPSSTTTSRPPIALPQQRHSEIPSGNHRPPNLAGSRPYPLPQEKKTLPYGESSSASRHLYASAKVKTSAPTVQPDWNKLAYQSDTPAAKKDDPHSQPSLYSSAVSSVMKKRVLPTAPLPRQSMIPEPRHPQPYYQPYQQPYQQGYQAQGSAYGSPPVAHQASVFYGQPHTQNLNQGFYSHPQQVYSQYQAPAQHQPVPPQGYPPTATQNNWSPAPDTWQNYGRY